MRKCSKMKILTTYTDGAGRDHDQIIDAYEGERFALNDGTRTRSIPRKRLKGQLGLFEPMQRKLFDKKR